MDLDELMKKLYPKDFMSLDELIKKLYQTDLSLEQNQAIFKQRIEEHINNIFTESYKKPLNVNELKPQLESLQKIVHERDVFYLKKLKEFTDILNILNKLFEQEQKK